MEFLSFNGIDFFRVAEEFWGLSYQSILCILDLMKYISDLYISNKNYNPKKFPMLRPFNCVYTVGGDTVIFGISSQNATPGSTVLAATTSILSSVEFARQHLVDHAFRGLNSDIECHIELDRTLLLDNESYLLEFSKMSVDEKASKLYEDFDIEIIEHIRINSQRMVDSFYSKEKIMNYNPIFRARDLKVDPNLIFCLLPFDNERLELFQEVIRPSIEKEHPTFTIIRADNLTTVNPIMEDVWTYICKARIIIADITKKNANVYYELGICHTVGKDVIIICDEDSFHRDYGGKFPFDIASLRIIIYKNSGSGPNRLAEDINNTIRTILDGEIIIS